MAELVTSLGEGGARLLLASPGESTPDELGRRIARMALCDVSTGHARVGARSRSREGRRHVRT